jgi:hypothetical protein
MQKHSSNLVRKDLSMVRLACVLVCGLGAACALSGCLVAGYSSSGGGFIRPGGFGLVLVLLLIFFLMRRR